ncbi:MAG: hypothetical protein JWO67_4050 [Streptosporangiaceae bacterium]|nr:hypothetical protein [Streptosporangiaceae bacterium]
MQDAEDTQETVIDLNAKLTEHGTDGRSLPGGDAPTELFVTVDYAATVFNVSRSHVIRTYQAGFIPGLRFCGPYRLLRTFVEALVAEINAGRQIDIEDFYAEWNAKSAENAA